jgi:hypothetical protein
MWLEMKTEILELYNMNVISSWIHEAEEGQTSDYEDLTLRCFRELIDCDFVILFSNDDEEFLKGALMEVGAALVQNKPVFYIGPPNQVSISRVFRKHPYWFDLVHSSVVPNFSSEFTHYNLVEIGFTHYNLVKILDTMKVIWQKDRN